MIRLDGNLLEGAGPANFAGGTPGRMAGDGLPADRLEPKPVLPHVMITSFIK
ncbi:MAG: hypothetical protein ABSH38_12875 [Verrucomicrobiota bacterium]